MGRFDRALEAHLQWAGVERVQGKGTDEENLHSRGLKAVTVETLRDPSCCTSGKPGTDSMWTQFESACEKSGQVVSEKYPLARRTEWQTLQSKLFDCYDTIVPKFVKDWISQAPEACTAHTQSGKHMSEEKERSVNGEVGV